MNMDKQAAGRQLASTELREYLVRALTERGASAVGFAKAVAVSPEAVEFFEGWLREGYAGALDYMHAHSELRRDPRTLLPGARTVVSVAWNYLPSKLRDASLPFVARYAYGRDYHKALRALIKPICREAGRRFGCGWRICIDSAPIAERYWAVKAGVGFIGRNGCLIVPGVGSWVFLTEILLTAEIEPTGPLNYQCEGCDACLQNCPTVALRNDGLVDTRRCLSCSTVEGTPLEARNAGTPHLLGCDRCQEICPHNRAAAPSDWLSPRPEILSISAESLNRMSEEEFRMKFAGTAFMRPGYRRLIDNINPKG